MKTDVQDIPVRKQQLFADEAGRLVEVVGTATGDIVEFCSQGGGFLNKAPHAEFDKHFKPATLPAFSLCAVSAEWLPPGLTFAAYSKGQRWNGWAMPYFPAESAMALREHLPGLCYDATRDVFVDDSEENEPDEVIFPAEEIIVDGKPVKVYAIGAGYWCWELEP